MSKFVVNMEGVRVMSDAIQSIEVGHMNGAAKIIVNCNGDICCGLCRADNNGDNEFAFADAISSTFCTVMNLYEETEMDDSKELVRVSELFANVAIHKGLTVTSDAEEEWFTITSADGECSFNILNTSFANELYIKYE